MLRESTESASCGGPHDALGRCSGEQVERLPFKTLLGLLPSGNGRAITHIHKGKPPPGSYQVTQPPDSCTVAVRESIELKPQRFRVLVRDDSEVCE